MLFLSRKLAGNPEFYQYNMLASSQTIRAIAATFFMVKAAFTIKMNFADHRRTLVLPGKIGLFALYDVGRVWLRGEKNDLWHRS